MKHARTLVPATATTRMTTTGWERTRYAQSLVVGCARSRKRPTTLHRPQGAGLIQSTSGPRRPARAGFLSRPGTRKMRRSQPATRSTKPLCLFGAARTPCRCGKPQQSFKHPFKTIRVAVFHFALFGAAAAVPCTPSFAHCGSLAIAKRAYPKRTVLRANLSSNNFAGAATRGAGRCRHH